MSHLSTSSEGPRTTVRSLSDGRIVGYVTQSSGCVVVAIVPRFGDWTYLTAESVEAGVDLLDRLTTMPNGEETYCGDMYSGPLSWSLYTADHEGRLLVGNAGQDSLFEITLSASITEAELMQLHTVIGFAVARLAVTR